MGVRVFNAPDVVLKSRAIFAQVVPEPGELGPRAAAEWLGEGSCHPRNLTQMFLERVDLDLVPNSAGVGCWLHGHSESLEGVRLRK